MLRILGHLSRPGFIYCCGHDELNVIPIYIIMWESVCAFPGLKHVAMLTALRDILIVQRRALTEQCSWWRDYDGEHVVSLLFSLYLLLSLFGQLEGHRTGQVGE